MTLADMIQIARRLAERERQAQYVLSSAIVHRDWRGRISWEILTEAEIRERGIDRRLAAHVAKPPGAV